MTKLLRLKLTSKVVLFVFMFNIISSCGGGGGGGGSQTTPTAQLIGANATYSSMQLAIAKISNSTLSKATYTGNINGIPISVFLVSDGYVCWSMPSLQNGNYILNVAIDGGNITIPLQVKNAVITDSLQTVLSNNILSIENRLNDDIAYLNSLTGQEGKITQLQKLKVDIENLPSQLSGMTEQEKEFFRQYLYSNIEPLTNYSQPVGKLTYKAVARPSPATGEEALQRIPWLLTALIIEIGGVIVGIGGAFAGAITLVGVALGLSTAVMAMSLILTHGLELGQCINVAFRDYIARPLAPGLKGIIRTYEEIEEARNSPKVTNKIINVNKSAGTTTAKVFNFDDGKSKDLYIESRYEITDSGIVSGVSAVNSGLSKLRSMIPQIKQYIPSVDASNFEDISLTKDDQPDANYYSVTSVSNSNILPTVSLIGKNIQLTFKFLNPPTSSTPVPFTFTLIDSRDNHTIDVSATLKPLTIDHIIVTAASSSVNVGGTTQLTATAYADVAGTVVVPTVVTDYTWTPSTSGTPNNTVDANGLFTAGSKAGQVIVTATHKGPQIPNKQDSTTITVETQTLIITVD